MAICEWLNVLTCVRGSQIPICFIDALRNSIFLRIIVRKRDEIAAVFGSSICSMAALQRWQLEAGVLTLCFPVLSKFYFLCFDYWP